MALEGWELVVTGVGIVGSTVGITRVMLKGAVSSIKHHCMMQKEACGAWHQQSERDREKIRERLEHHGHKGLTTENGNKVTIGG